MRQTPSLTFGEDAYAVGDTLRFRMGLDPWRRGVVLRLSFKRQAIEVQPEEGLDRQPRWVTPGVDGEVAPLHGADLVQAREDGAPTPPPSSPSSPETAPALKRPAIAALLY